MHSRSKFTTPALFVLLLTLGALSLGGQGTESKDGPIAGTLVNSVTGLAISEAEVTLRQLDSRPGLTRTTDAQGRFRFDAVPFGRYTLQATKPGYARMSYGSTAIGNPGRVLAIASDRGITGLEYKLTPLGVIQGKVVDKNGEPVPKVTLACGYVDIYGAPPTMEPLKNLTDDRGEFRLSDMPAGRYFVQALPQPGTNLPAFYPSAGTFGEAQPIDLATGQEASGIKITLREVPVFHIKGKVTGAAENTALSDLDLLLFIKDEGGQLKLGQGYADVLSRRVGGSRAVRADGTFELSNVEPGFYELAAVATVSKNRVTLGRAVVNVGDRDLADVLLPLGDFVQMSLRLQSDSDQDLSGVSCSILGLPMDGDPTTLAIMGTTGSNRIFTYDRAIPQKYVLTAKCQPRPWVVKAAFLEGNERAQDILDAGLNLAAGRVVVNLVLSKETGVVVVNVKDKAVPAPSRWVTLIPEPPQPGKFVHERSGWSDEDGRLVIQNVTPGDYRVYAWQQSSAAASCLNPMFLERFTAQSTKVTVKAGEQIRVEAKSIEP